MVQFIHERTEDMVRSSFYHLQNVIGQGNAHRGFHAEGDELRANAGSEHEYDTAMLRNYYMVKVGLIMSEGAEALEELRSGRPVSQNYYTINGQEVFPATDGQGADWTTRSDGLTNDRDLELTETWTGVLPKPEGVPSEIADIVIRCFDFADEAGFSLIEAILEKLAYNDTRAHMHGRQV